MKAGTLGLELLLSRSKKLEFAAGVRCSKHVQVELHAQQGGGGGWASILSLVPIAGYCIGRDDSSEFDEVVEGIYRGIQDKVQQ